MVLLTHNIKTKMSLTRTVTWHWRYVVNEPLHRCNLPAFVFAIFRLQDLENQEYPVSAAARMKTRKKRMRLHQRVKTPRKGLKENPGNQRQDHSGRAIRRAWRRRQDRWMQPQAERKKMTRLMNRWWKAQRKRETLYPPEGGSANDSISTRTRTRRSVTEDGNMNDSIATRTRRSKDGATPNEPANQSRGRRSSSRKK